MAEENVVMNLSAHADFSNLVANVNKVSASLVKMQQQVGTSNRIVAGQIAAINKAFSDTLKNTGQFNTHFVTLSDDVAKFGNSLDKGQLKLRDYYSAWQQHNKTSGGLVRDLARQQVQLQNAILQPLGKNAQGLQQFNVQVASGLDLVKHKGAIATEELKIMNRVMQQGADGLINWGKNTQWAGRQLTVGLTVPIAAFGMAAAKAFREADAELVRLTKVYGGVAAVSTAELKKIRNEVSATATELSKAYGTSFKETIGLAADLAATGKQGNDLLKATAETTRLMVLGEVDRQDAMKTTLTIQNTFNQSTKELAESIDFLNAVENQTSLTIQDLTEAIPKAGPVVKALGGDVKDLALYLTAMKEGGINASEGANAIKSALASLINPTKVSTELFESFGINLRGIVENNRGDVTQMLLSLQSALDGLDPLSKSRAIEQLFGKFQFARISALIDNLGKSGSQSLQVLDLLKKSTSEIGALADRELKQVTESASGKYNRAVEGLRADLAGIGDEFLKVATFFINITDKVVNFVNKLPGPIKSILTFLAGLTAVSGPLIMLAGVMANFIGYVIKGAFHLKALFKSGEGWRMLTPEILAAQKAGSLVEKTFYSDAQAALALAEALAVLNSGYTTLNANINKGVVSVQPQIQTLAGSVVIPGGQGARFVDPRNPLVGEKGTRASAHTNPLAGRTAEQIAQSTIYGFTPAAIPVNNAIKDAPQMYSSGDLPSVPGLTTAMSKKHGEVSVGIVAQEATKWHTLMGTLSMMSKTEVATMKKEIHATGAVSSDFMAAYSSLLPEITKISEDAVTKSAAIVSQVKSGEMSIAAAKEKLIQLNYQIEAAMGTATTGVATSLGRTANLTTVPTLDQPVVDPTGKSNMRQIFGKKNAAWMDKLASAMGVKTWGASYSTHTTIPKRLNAGGAVYDPARDGNVVPGDTSINYDNTPAVLREGGFVLNQDASRKNPDLVGLARNGYNSGGRVVDALLTPGETYFPPEMAQSMMPVLEKANSGSRISLRNAGGILGGLVNGGRYGYGKNSILAAFERETKKAAKGRSRDAILNPLGISVRGQRVESFVSQIGEISDQALRQKYLTITKQFAKKIKTEPGDDPRFFNRRKKETLAAKNIEDLNDLYTRWGLPPLPSKQDWHGTHWTVSDLLGKGRSLISDYIVNYSAKSNLAANQNKLTAEGLFRRDLVIRPGINKYEKQLKAAGIPKDQWDSAELNIDESIRSFFLKEARDKSLSLDQIFIGDRPGKAGYTFTQHFIPLLEKELKNIDPYSVYKPSYQKLKTNRKVRQTLNMGGMVGGKVKTGKYGYGYKPPQWAVAGNTGKNKFKGEYKSPLHLTPEYEDYISKTQADYWDKLPKDESGRYWYTPEQLRLQREGKARAFTYPQPKRFYQDLSNDNPLHGALQIGAYQAPMHVRNQYVGAQLRYRMPVGKNWRDEGFTKPAPVLGSVEDRAKSALFRYMQGDYQAIGSKEVQDYLSTIRTKFTGTLHRGVNWRTSDSLPPFIKKMIEEKRWSDLVGQEFIMRRSSWSKNPKTAQGFGLGIEGKGYNQVVLTADVKNRNAVPASEIFPDLTFQTAKGPVAVNESEVYMGGKFKIVSAANGKIKLQAVYDQQVDGKREHGGPVNAGRPYLVGEKGPELFVPKNAGGIVSNYALGGMVRSNKTGYGKMGPVAKYVGKQALMMAAFQMLMPMLSKIGLPKVVTDNAFNAMFMGQVAHGAYKTNKAFKAQRAAQAGTAIGDTAVAAEGAEKAVAKFSPRLLALGSVAARVAGPIGLVLTGIQAYQMIQDKKRAEQDKVATSFGMTAAKAKEAGLAIKNLDDQLKASSDKVKASRANAALLFGADKSNVTGISLTVKELKDLEKSVKKTMPSYVEAFKKMTGKEVLSGAARIKAQWVGLGMSVDEANAKIYSLVKMTHGEAAALSTMQDSSFQSITDKASAAKESINILSAAIKNVNAIGTKGVADSLNTFLQVQTASYQNLIANPKDKNTDSPYSDALKETLGSYGKAGNLKLPQGTIDELAKTQPILASILNSSDTIRTSFDKWVIATSASVENLAKIANLEGPAAAKVAAGIAAIQDASYAALSNDPIIGKVEDKIDSLRKSIAANEKAARGMSVVDQVAAKNKIKSIEAEIKKINEAAAARKKSMEQQQTDEDVLTQIKKKQLDYQQALASGDMIAAAQAQLDIQMLSGNRQLEVAKNSIDIAAKNQTDPLQAQLEALNESLNKSADAAAIAADSASRSADTLNSLVKKDNALKDALVKAMDDKLLFGSATKSDLKNLLDAYGQAGGLKKVNGAYVGADGKPLDAQKLFDTLSAQVVKQVSIQGNTVIVNGAIQGASGAGLNGDTSNLSIEKQIAIATAASNKKKGKYDSSVPNTPTGVTGQEGSATAIHNPKAPKPEKGKLFTQIGESIWDPKIQKLSWTDSKKNLQYLPDGNVFNTKTKMVVGQWFAKSDGPGGQYTGPVMAYAMGGAIRRYEDGSTGGVRGPGTGTSDSIPAMLSNGEYVIKADSVKKYGISTFDALNAQKFATGGKVSGISKTLKDFSLPHGSKDRFSSNIFGYGGSWETPEQVAATDKFVKDNIMEMTGIPAGKRIFTGNSENILLDLISMIPIITGTFKGLRAISRMPKMLDDLRLLKGSTHNSWDPDLKNKTLDPLTHVSSRADSLNRGNYLSTGDPLDFAPNLYSLSLPSLIKGSRGKGLITEEKWRDVFGGGKFYPSMVEKTSPEFYSYLKSGYTGITKDVTKEVALKYPVKYKNANPEDFIKPKPPVVQETLDEMLKRFRNPDGTPKGIKNGGYINFHKGGPVGHRHGRNLPETKKDGWLQRYANNLTAKEEATRDWLNRSKLTSWAAGSADPLGTNTLIRKLAGTDDNGSALGAALFFTNFMGFGAGPKLAQAGRVAGVLPETKAGTSAVKSFMLSNSKAKQLVNSIYTRKDMTVGEKIYPTYKLNGEKERIVFQGYKENLSKLDGTGVRVVKTTPESLLEEALRLNPNSKNLTQLLDNFKNNKIGRQERIFLDSMLAATGVNNKGKPTFAAQTDGFAMLLSSLSGNKTAEDVVKIKRDYMYDIIKRNKKAEAAKRFSREIPEDVPLPSLDDITVFHSTKYPLVRDADGNFIFYPHGQYADKATGVPRGSFHTTLEAGVTGHAYGSWSNTNNRIFAPFSSMVKDNKLPYNFNSSDTWWQTNPGQAIKMSNGVAHRPFTNVATYYRHLLKSGLIKNGQQAPLISMDPATNEIYTLHKPRFTPAEVDEIVDLARKNGMVVHSDYAKADGNKVLSELAEYVAKKKIGTNPRLYNMGMWGLEADQNNFRQQQLYKLAEFLNLRQKIHMGSDVERLEKHFMTPSSQNSNWNMFRNESGLGGNSIEAMRFAAMFGRFKTNIRSKLDELDYDDDDWAPIAKTSAATGGYLKNGKLLQNFASGGLANIPKFENGINMVPADMLAMIHKNEAVVPANMNPFNPNANNATMGNTIYLTNNITAAPGMDTELLARRVAEMTKQSLSADMNISASKVGINNQFGSKVMN